MTEDLKLTPQQRKISDAQKTQTPPRENTAAWVENYVSWASKVLDDRATRSDKD